MLKALHIPSLSNEADCADQQTPGKEKPLQTNGSVGHPEYLRRGVYQQKQMEMGDTTLLYIQYYPRTYDMEAKRGKKAQIRFRLKGSIKQENTKGLPQKYEEKAAFCHQFYHSQKVPIVRILIPRETSVISLNSRYWFVNAL